MGSRNASIALALLAAGSLSGAALAETVERRVRSMGTELSIVVDAANRDDALEASERAVAALRETEARLSTWTPDSELSRFNRAPAGRATSISSRLARDLAQAQRCGVDTDGAFSPGLGALVRAWGLRDGGRRPQDDELDSLLPGLRFDRLLVEVDRATRLDERFAVEEGAFGKGVGLDDARDALDATAATAAVLNLGGQVAVWGSAAASIEIAAPRDRRRVLLRLSVPHGSVATTGNSERGIVVDGTRLGHVLDPATGRPAPDFGSVTVWAPEAVRADCLATGLYVMGPERALAWAARHPRIGVVVIEERDDGPVVSASANLRHFVKPLLANLELSFHDTPRPGAKRRNP